MRHYARAIELGNDDTLAVQIYASKEKTGFALYEDDGLSNDYLQGIYSTTKMQVRSNNSNLLFTIDPVIGTYQGQNPNRYYELYFHDVPEPESLRLWRDCSAFLPAI